MNSLQRATDKLIQIPDRLRVAYKKNFGNRNYKKFIVLGRSRIGSSLLVSLMKKHPHTRIFGEKLRELRDRRVETILNDLYCGHDPWIKAVGFKVFYYHPLDDKSQTLWQLLEDLDDFYVIHLKRQNILRTALSAKIASKLKRWRIREHSNEREALQERQVSFEIAELEAEFSRTRNYELAFDRRFAANNLLEVFYEDLDQDREGCLRSIYDFLGLEYFSACSDILKQNPEKLSEIITNYADLKAHFSTTPWASFFED